MGPPPPMGPPLRLRGLKGGSQSPPSPEVPFVIRCLGRVMVSVSPLAFLTGASDPREGVGDLHV